MLLQTFNARRQQAARFMLVAALLLLHLNVSWHSSLGHRAQPATVATEQAHAQIHRHHQTHSTQHQSNEQYLSNEYHLANDHHHAPSVDHSSSEIQDFKKHALEHSHQSLYPAASVLLPMPKTLTADYRYNRSHRAPSPRHWLRPPRANLAT